MTAFLICPGCGERVRAQERYCCFCGMDTLCILDPPPVMNNDIPESRIAIFKRGITSIKIVVLLLLLPLGAGGIYWWISNMAPLTAPTTNSLADVNQGEANSLQSSELKQAAAYLPKEGLALTFWQRYPDGASGTMERITARLAPGKIAVTELESMQANGKQYSYAFHYFQRDDGVYLVYDQTPQDYIPILKNNLRPGFSWEYQDEDARTVWTVLALGERLNLGFIKLDNCLLVAEESDAADYCKIICYAPGIGRVMEKTADTGQCLMTMTSMGSIDPELAAQETGKWAQNYRDIKVPGNSPAFSVD